MSQSLVGAGPSSLHVQSYPSTDGPALTPELPSEYFLVQCPFCAQVRAWRPRRDPSRRLRIKCGAPCSRWYQSRMTRRKFGSPRKNGRASAMWLARLAPGVSWSTAVQLASRMTLWLKMKQKRRHQKTTIDPGPQPVLKYERHWYPTSLPEDGYSTHLALTYPIQDEGDPDLWVVPEEVSAFGATL